MVEKKDPFTLKKLEAQPYEYINNVHITVRIEVDPHLQRVERNVYTVFGLLSDVGGLAGLLGFVFMILDHLWSFSSLDYYLIQRLYRIEKDEVDLDDGCDSFPFQSSIFPHCGTLFCSCAPKKCPCKSRSRRAFDKAQEKLDYEISVVDWLKNKRYFKMALKEILPKRKRKEL